MLTRLRLDRVTDGQTSQQTTRGLENTNFRGIRTTKGRLLDRQKPPKNCLEMERKTAQSSVQCKAILVLDFPAYLPQNKQAALIWCHWFLATGDIKPSSLQFTKQGSQKRAIVFSLFYNCERWQHCSPPHTEPVQTQLYKYRHNYILLDYSFPHSSIPLL